ncbi:MAG: cytochrome c [Methyloceanibacter sp.]|nr:cytochrome c [Methyloceanibacter sp.]
MRVRLGGTLQRCTRYRRFAAWLSVGALVLLVFAVRPALASDTASTEQNQIDRGAAILLEHCARCHAIGVAGDSPNDEAPPFRTLSENYPVENLAESLAEGIMTGHPDMPVFVFKPTDVDAVIAYLQSIQVTPVPAETDG